MDEARLVLAKTIYGEARGEGYAGMQAVANVIMKRVSLPGWWGDSIISVCKTPLQFSAWNEGDPNAAIIQDLKPGDNPVFDLAYQIAGLAIDGDLEDVTGGATHYYNPQYANPDWAETWAFKTTIGNHDFGVA